VPYPHAHRLRVQSLPVLPTLLIAEFFGRRSFFAFHVRSFGPRGRNVNMANRPVGKVLNETARKKRGDKEKAPDILKPEAWEWVLSVMAGYDSYLLGVPCSP
jgi:hypothetical protein